MMKQQNIWQFVDTQCMISNTKLIKLFTFTYKSVLYHYKSMMKINFVPKSGLGKWSIGLIVVVPIFFYIGILFVRYYKSVPAGKTILCDIVARPGVSLAMLAGFVSGIAAFFCGIIGITKRKDYSVLAFISTIVGFFVLLWCLAQFVFPL